MLADNMQTKKEREILTYKKTMSVKEQLLFTKYSTFSFPFFLQVHQLQETKDVDIFVNENAVFAE